MSSSPMPSGRHSARHAGPSKRSWSSPKAAAAFAGAATVMAVGLGVATIPSGSEPASVLSAQDIVAASAITDRVTHSSAIEERKTALSRDADRRGRIEVRRDAVTRWTTTSLNLWTSSGQKAKQDGTLETATKIKATGRKVAGRDEILVDGDVRWVTSGHLAKKKPVAPVVPASAVSDAACANTSVERGMKANTIKLYRSLCAAFPEVTTYGGVAGRIEHNTGNAIDLMVYGDKALGDRIAAWIYANRASFDLYNIIWYQKIWTPVRAAEGWRHMSDRGSATANHIDHVHVATNP